MTAVPENTQRFDEPGMPERHWLFHDTSVDSSIQARQANRVVGKSASDGHPGDLKVPRTSPVALQQLRLEFSRMFNSDLCRCDDTIDDVFPLHDA